MSFAFAAGTTDGPGAFDFTQGDDQGNAFWKLTGGLMKKPAKEQINQDPKPVLIDTGEIHEPYDWKEFAPKVDAYNNFLAKAIAGGTGQIVKGSLYVAMRFSNPCSWFHFMARGGKMGNNQVRSKYKQRVQKGGNMILNDAMEGKNGMSKTTTNESNNKSNGSRKGNGISKSLKSVRNLSKMTESMSKATLNSIGIASESVMGPVVRSQAGKTFFSLVPGEVLLTSLDAVNTVMDAAEAAKKQALSATSGAATRMVSERFGETAGEATGDVLATAGHVAGTAWNVIKIRKAIIYNYYFLYLSYSISKVQTFIGLRDCQVLYRDTSTQLSATQLSMNN